MAISTLDEQMLSRCYRIARFGHGFVSPNPCVGAILVYKGQIIGEGYHKQIGARHAEVECLQSVKLENRNTIKQSTMYVSLEPCSHHGRTPPCAEEIIKHQVRRVVVGLKDPNPKVAGKGISLLRNQGIQVDIASVSDEAISTAHEFLVNQVLHRPFITLKWAQSRDGYLGKVDHSTKISGAHSDVMVHKWRSEADAILVGTNTAILDNPRLTTRLIEGKSPDRIIIDRNGSIPTHYHLLADGNPTIIFGKRRLDKNEAHLQFVDIAGDDHLEEIRQMLKKVSQREIHSIIVEGGAKLLRSFIAGGLWDKACIITSPLKIENGIKAPTLLGKLIAKHTLGSDSVQEIRNEVQMEQIKGSL